MQEDNYCFTKTEWCIVAAIAILLALVILTSCSSVTPEQTQQAKDAIKNQINKPENQKIVIDKINEVMK